MKPSEIMEKVRLRIEGEGTQVARAETAGIFTEKEIAQYNAISEPPKFDLITVGKDENGEEHRVLGVNGSPDLMVMPEGIEGLKPLPVRLQEDTVKGKHFRKHEEDLKRLGYKSAEHAVIDITQNFDRIYTGEKPNQAVLVRPIVLQQDGQLIRGILLTEFQEVAGAYRVGSVFATSDPRYLKNRKLLWGKSHPNRLRQETPLRTQGLTGPEQVPFEDSIGQVVGNVKGESLFQRGYIGRSESVRASEARQEGQKPLSKWTKKAIIEAMKANGAPEELLRKAEAQPLWVLQRSVLSKTSWHHTLQCPRRNPRR